MSILKRLLKFLAIGLLGFVIMLSIIGRTYQVVAENQDLERYPPPGRLLDVRGTDMHIHCYGEGSPTVVFEQGLGALNETWEDIFAPIAEMTRVCYYDRVGMGYSEPLDRGTPAPEVAARLQELLIAAGEYEEMVLVGWSAGGVYIREFYYQFPELVQGMVFVDSSHEQQQLRFPPAEGNSNTMLRIGSYLAPIGLVRLSGLVESQLGNPDMDAELQARIIARYSTSHALQTMLAASSAFNADTMQENPPAALGDLPIVVLTQGNAIEPPEGEEPSDALLRQREVREVWNVLQTELAELSTNSRHIIATESGHSIHADQPDLVIDSIKDLVSIARESK
ncbi:MAG: alpha/beta hydrolase [Pseudomonadales bacterium]|nr:alpha/beta hydrolase [Pseudomonadales bacterium]